MAEYLAFDTECFGLYPLHGDHPFLVSTCDENLRVKVYEPQKIIDSKRKAIWSPITIKEINKNLEKAKNVVGHNLPFDVLASRNIGVNLYNLLVNPTNDHPIPHDTSILSHIIYNNESHKLKDLAFKYLGIPAFDEHLVHEAILKIHALRRSNKIDIDYQPHPLAGKETTPESDYHLVHHHPTLASVIEKYAGLDALRTMLLLQLYLKNLSLSEKEGGLGDRSQNIQKIYSRERKLMLALLRQADNPIHIRKNNLCKLIKNAKEVSNKLTKEILSIGKKYDPSFENPNSDTQVRRVLFEKMKVPVAGRTPKGDPSVNKESLKTLLKTIDEFVANKKVRNDCLHDAKEIVAKTLELSKLATINQYNLNYKTHAVKWDTPNPHLYFSFNPQGTRFVRGSSSRPNLQNVGSKDRDSSIAEYFEEHGESSLYGVSLRSSFGPPKGYVWLSLDYSQIELQTFAKACNSKRLRKLLQDGDIHGQVEWELFKTKGPNRTNAKICNFSLIYGKQESNFDAMTFPGAYKKYTTSLFPEVGPFITDTSEFVSRNGYVETFSGYRLHLDPRKPYVGVNAICQGSAGDIIKLAQIAIDLFLQSKGKGSGIKPILQIHDELVFLAPANVDLDYVSTILAIMQQASRYYGVPCKTDCEIIRESWDKPEKLELPDEESSKRNLLARKYVHSAAENVIAV